ncbi:putative 3-demethylubiquinone-9 3-methyltransferase (glyoxalase superfamily) [Nocardioides daedukensis]|uniref:Putative 3-demethylubiquinone-9 3-methyltransferase (Glyoxalase superfamily) n=1 Tax=Nocardioides daedukensis TaxID=634462 RepID=A0A7Y9S3C9_9ACTN|nr:VOC family protein [Nocardioides daedukensis]NYG59313.1 putative 3-demethylubiquinone-9 3-methyltransferase (glyoxalase superfamily) [Nocardioides daedukensis]
MSITNKITPNLWFDREAEQAAAQYIDAFGGQGRVIRTVAAHPDAPSPQDVPMLVEFELFGQRFVGINGGPQFTFNEAMSLEVRVDDQAELDRVWAALVDGGSEMPCGWLKDRYGVCWQVTPAQYDELMAGDDEEAKQRLMEAVLATFGKFDIAALEAAYAGQAGSPA